MDIIIGIGSVVLMGLCALQLIIAVLTIAGAALMLPLMPLTIAVEAWLRLRK